MRGQVPGAMRHRESVSLRLIASHAVWVARGRTERVAVFTFQRAIHYWVVTGRGLNAGAREGPWIRGTRRRGDTGTRGLFQSGDQAGENTFLPRNTRNTRKRSGRNQRRFDRGLRGLTRIRQCIHPRKSAQSAVKSLLAARRFGAIAIRKGSYQERLGRIAFSFFRVIPCIPWLKSSLQPMGTRGHSLHTTRGRGDRGHTTPPLSS